MTIEQRLKDKGIVIPEPAPRLYAYTSVHVHRDVAYLAGQIPKVDRDNLLHTGRVGAEVSLAQAQACARLTVVNGLAWLRKEIGSLDRVASVLRLTGYVTPAPDFTRISDVIEAATAQLVDIFGEHGASPRSVIGVTQLPYSSPVLLEMTFALTADAP